jgi:hypothetical protein
MHGEQKVKSNGEYKIDVVKGAAYTKMNVSNIELEKGWHCLIRKVSAVGHDVKTTEAAVWEEQTSGTVIPESRAVQLTGNQTS